jgi:hypothetical protein
MSVLYDTSMQNRGGANIDNGRFVCAEIDSGRVVCVGGSYGDFATL